MNKLPVFTLKSGRIHESYGASAHSFALIMAAKTTGSILWLRAPYSKVDLLPEAIQAFLSPERIILATPSNVIDLLAVAEEALKSSCLGLVVIEISAPLNLREGRRLQLAAKAGSGLGICLLANEEMGSNAAETRWYCSPLYDPKGEDSTLMQWQIKKNKSGTLGAWHVRWDEKAHHIDMAAAPLL